MQTIKTVDELFYRELGKELRLVRQDRKLTLSELSSLTGISRSQLDHYELGFNKIKPKTYEKICDALNTSTSMKIEITIGFTK